MMKRGCLLIPAVLLGFILGIIFMWDEKIKDYETVSYRDEKLGLKMEVPKGWKKSTHEFDEKEYITFRKPSRGWLEDGYDSLSIHKEKIARPEEYKDHVFLFDAINEEEKLDYQVKDYERSLHRGKAGYRSSWSLPAGTGGYIKLKDGKTGFYTMKDEMLGNSGPAYAYQFHVIRGDEKIEVSLISYSEHKREIRGMRLKMGKLMRTIEIDEP
jgi:hypothetical protein